MNINTPKQVKSEQYCLFLSTLPIKWTFPSMCCTHFNKYLKMLSLYYKSYTQTWLKGEKVSLFLAMCTT